MTRNLIFLSFLLFFVACGNPQADQKTPDTAVHSPDSSREASAEERPQQENRKKWTNLESLNRDTDYPFKAEDSLIGMGAVSLCDTMNTYDQILRLYGDAGKVMVTVERKDSDVITVFKGKTYHRNDPPNSFKPRLFIPNPDYFRLAFDCIRKDAGFYTVIIDRQTGETAKIKANDPYFQFETPEEFVDGWTDIGLDFDRSANPLRTTPSDTSGIIGNELLARYPIWSAEKTSMQGDWMEIKTEDTAETGWIRWRRGNQILIRMYYAC